MYLSVSWFETLPTKLRPRSKNCIEEESSQVILFLLVCDLLPPRHFHVFVIFTNTSVTLDSCTSPSTVKMVCVDDTVVFPTVVSTDTIHKSVPTPVGCVPDVVIDVEGYP
jgi:hypothetical protein